MIGTRPSSMLGDRLGRSAASPHLDTKPRAARDCRRIPARRAFRRPCKGVVARGAHGKRGVARVASCVARIPLTVRGRFGAWRGSLPAWRKSSNVSLLRRGVIRSQRRPAAGGVGVRPRTGTYWGALRELDDLLDDQMRSMSKQIQVDDAGKLSIEGRDRLAKRHPADYDSDDVLLQVWRGGQLEFTTDPATQLPPPAAAGFVTLDAGGQRWHTYVRESAGTTIRVAQPRQARWEAIAGIAVHLLWPVLSLLPLLAIGLWLGIGYGLRPLGAIAAGLKRRHANRLDPLDITTVPTEAQPLASEINDLLARLDRSFTLQRHFIADAAHELRTPIMGLSIQTQLLQRTASADERARILAQIQAGTTRLSHLAEQLLTLARLEPEARSAPFAELDLAALGRSGVAERARIAAARRRVHRRRAAGLHCVRLIRLLSQMTTDVRIPRYSPRLRTTTRRTPWPARLPTRS